MRVFITGATGFIGSAVVKELLGAGYQVLGMSRSEAGAKSLSAMGAQVHPGALEDLDSLRSGAAGADAVIHLAFIHDFSKFQENCLIDQRAIEALGAALAGSDRPLIVSAGTGLISPGKPATEDMDLPPHSPIPRVSEQAALALKGVRAFGHPPAPGARHRQARTRQLFHSRGPRKRRIRLRRRRTKPLAGRHVLDVAHLYRLVLEKNEPGAKYHAVAEEGVRTCAIAEAIGQGLKIPVISISPDQAPAHFGFLAPFASLDIPASSAITRQKLGWNPTGPGMIADLEAMRYV